MSFFKPTVNDAIYQFTKALNKLHAAADVLREEFQEQKDIIFAATQKQTEIASEVVRAEHLISKFENFLK